MFVDNQYTWTVRTAALHGMSGFFGEYFSVCLVSLVICLKATYIVVHISC